MLSWLSEPELRIPKDSGKLMDRFVWFGLWVFFLLFRKERHFRKTISPTLKHETTKSTKNKKALQQLFWYPHRYTQSSSTRTKFFISISTFLNFLHNLSHYFQAKSCKILLFPWHLIRAAGVQRNENTSLCRPAPIKYKVYFFNPQDQFLSAL